MRRTRAQALLLQALAALSIMAITTPAFARRMAPRPRPRPRPVVVPANNGLNPNGAPNFQGAAVHNGFMPDPVVLQGRSGGNVQAQRVDPACRGWVSTSPDHVIDVPNGISNLRFVVDAPADTTLLVMRPNGRIHCDDDGGQGRNPMLQLRNIGRGVVRVWVGSYQRGQGGNYRLGLTERPHIMASHIRNNVPGPRPGTPAAPGARVTPNAQPNFQGANIGPGFMPDPVILAGRSGGPVQASTLDPQCRGYISPRPDHVIQANGGFRQLRLVVRADRDTTLVVMLPNGRILCDDDGGVGTNPLLQFATRRPGQIRVWVGSYSQRMDGDYRLAVTERAHIDANSPSLGGRGAPQAPPPPVRVNPQGGPAHGPAHGPTGGGAPAQQPPVQVGRRLDTAPAGLRRVQVGPNVTGVLLEQGRGQSNIGVVQQRNGQIYTVYIQGGSVWVGDYQVAQLPAMRRPDVTAVVMQNGQLRVRVRARGSREATELFVNVRRQPVVTQPWTRRMVR